MKYIWSILMPRICLILILVLPLPLMAQSNPWPAWDADVVRALNTAADTEYLNEEEKKVVLFMNITGKQQLYKITSQRSEKNHQPYTFAPRRGSDRNRSGSRSEVRRKRDHRS